VEYWAIPASDLTARIATNAASGLSSKEARRRLLANGPNTLRIHSEPALWRLLASQFRSPLMWILGVAAIISALVGEWIDAAIVFLVVASSAILSFLQEFAATRAMEKLRQRVRMECSVWRDGAAASIPAEHVVSGDIVLLSAGSLVPADGIVLESRDCLVNQAVLTGETYPAPKSPGVSAGQSGLAERENCVFMGTSVRSGTAKMLVVLTGTGTAFGQIAEKLVLRPPETSFERGVRHFGYLLTEAMLVLVLAVFAINVLLAKPAIDSLLFAIALAVGIAPELLPAILSITLAHGAQRMAKRGVIVRRLNAIENFGSMNVLCTDKTGTLTCGEIHLQSACDLDGAPSAEVAGLAYLNARFQSGMQSPLDQAIIAATPEEQRRIADLYGKTDEIPYDFSRKRISVALQSRDGSSSLQVTKGALTGILEISRVSEETRQRITLRYEQWGSEGMRVLGVATRNLNAGEACQEKDLEFRGFLLFQDPPKPGIDKTVADLKKLGVELKIITGDNRHVAAHVAASIGIPAASILTGAEMQTMPDEALWRRSVDTNLFVEVDPNQKERVILALRKMGRVTGYMGDGINDAPALHAADAGISVDTAVDVARESADFVLLEQDLDVLREGIEEGRRTFANTLKYVFTTTSANFGNMISMAGASAFLPFLPLLAKQILLNNFLSDFPGMTIAGDRVDDEWLKRPLRWNIAYIRRFMIVFGLVSSVFDYLTFGLLLYVFRLTPAEFRTGWFIESLLTELVVALVVRTRLPFYRSRPGEALLWSTIAVGIVTFGLPYIPGSAYLGFTPLPLPLIATLCAITLGYVLAVEVTKSQFHRRYSI
jgi:P-type Mg2+ transporter